MCALQNRPARERDFCVGSRRLCLGIRREECLLRLFLTLISHEGRSQHVKLLRALIASFAVNVSITRYTRARRTRC